MTHISLPLSLKDGFLADEEGDGCKLRVGRCRCSDRTFFPARAYCPQCLEPMEIAYLSGRGHIYAATIVRRRAPFDLPEPYAIGYVDMADAPLRIFGLFDPAEVAELAPGREVDLKVVPLGSDNNGEPCLRPIFHLTGGQRHG